MIYNPLVSVIIPVFNGEKYVAQALESLLEQDYPLFEVIAVDDGSIDRTREIIERYHDINYIYQSNRGVSSARNTGIATSRGDIIAFLDSDDFWPSGRLTATIRYFQRYPDIGYVLGKQMMFLEPGCRIPPWVRKEWLEEPQDVSNTGVLVVRRETFERIGTFNEDYRSGEDTEWLLRASEAGIPMARLQEVVLYRRIHGENLSARMIQMREANLIKIARESVHRKKERREKS